MQKIPVFQGLRVNDAVARGESVASQAIAQDILPVPELDQRLPVQNIHEAADAEELLKELDACGVSILS